MFHFTHNQARKFASIARGFGHQKSWRVSQAAGVDIKLGVESRYELCTNGWTDRQTDRGDYIEPRRVNPGSNIRQN